MCRRMFSNQNQTFKFREFNPWIGSVNPIKYHIAYQTSFKHAKTSSPQFSTITHQIPYTTIFLFFQNPKRDTQSCPEARSPSPAMSSPPWSVTKCTSSSGTKGTSRRPSTASTPDEGTLGKRGTPPAICFRGGPTSTPSRGRPCWRSRRLVRMTRGSTGVGWTSGRRRPKIIK